MDIGSQIIYNKLMILIIGLGNPGKKFKNTRHNIGFSVLDYFKKTREFSNWKKSKKFQAKISQGKIGRHKIILAKPQTFMNNSGKSVKTLTTYYKLQTTNLFVVHDDLDIALGKIKISKSRGAAGHNGVQSIINEIGSKNFIRFRIGIYGNPISRGYRIPKNSLKNFVLQEFTIQEQKTLKQIKKRACDALEKTTAEGA